MEKEITVVAVELGSSKISGIAVQKNSDGRMEVLASASVPSSSFIHQGAVYNVDKTASGIVMLLELLERQLGNRKIEKVYTGFAGKSLRSVPVSISREIGEDGIVTAQTVDEMLAECEEFSSEDMLSLSIASQEFVADNKGVPEMDPVGVACSKIEGRFQKITIRPKLFKLMDDSFSRSSLEIADTFVMPVTLASMVLAEDEMQKGCALVDYGAETTTVSVYKGGQLCYLRVLPIGSDAITSDIAKTFHLNYDEAESLKCIYGLFGYSGSQEEYAEISGHEIPLKQLGDVTEARNEEILTNVLCQLRNSGYYDSLFGGIVVTGGGSNLRKLETAMSHCFGGVSPVRIVRDVPSDISWGESEWCLTDASHLGILSFLPYCDEECCSVKEVKDMYAEPTPEDQANMVMGSLFNDEGEAAQADRDRKEKEKAQAEAERRRAEQGADEDEKNTKSKKSTLLDSARLAFHKFFEDVQ